MICQISYIFINKQISVLFHPFMAILSLTSLNSIYGTRFIFLIDSGIRAEKTYVYPTNQLILASIGFITLSQFVRYQTYKASLSSVLVRR